MTGIPCPLPVYCDNPVITDILRNPEESSLILNYFLSTMLSVGTCRSPGGNNRRRLHGGVRTSDSKRKHACAWDSPDVVEAAFVHRLVRGAGTARLQAATEDRTSQRSVGGHYWPQLLVQSIKLQHCVLMFRRLDGPSAESDNISMSESISLAKIVT